MPERELSFFGGSASISYVRLMVLSLRIIFWIVVMILKGLGRLRELVHRIGLDLMFLRLFSFGVHSGTLSDCSLLWS